MRQLRHLGMQSVAARTPVRLSGRARAQVWLHIRCVQNQAAAGAGAAGARPCRSL